jgi:hypothetical protein
VVIQLRLSTSTTWPTFPAGLYKLRKQCNDICGCPTYNVNVLLWIKWLLASELIDRFGRERDVNILMHKGYTAYPYAKTRILVA